MREFQRLQVSLSENEGLVTVDVNKNSDNWWYIYISRMTFDGDGKQKDYKMASWYHFPNHTEKDEQENESKLAAFKEKFNLK